MPLFAKELEQNGREEARAFAEEAMSGPHRRAGGADHRRIVAMPWLMYLLAPGFSVMPEKFELAVLLTQITLPYLLCMSLVALFSGVLNTFGKFVESSSVSIVLNLTLAVAIFVGFGMGFHNEPGGGIIQAIGVFVAGVLQLWLLIDGLRRNNFTLKLRRPRMTDDMRRLITLGIPGVIAGGVTQINIMIGTVIASQQPGAVSQLYYADRLYELPLAIVGIAIGVVLLPDVSRKLRAGNHAAVLDSQNRSLEFAMLLTVAGRGGACRGADRRSSRCCSSAARSRRRIRRNTAAVLCVFALGLPAFVMIKVFSPAYFAREDTKTPMRYAALSLAANTVGSIALFFLFRSSATCRNSASRWRRRSADGSTPGFWATLVKRGHFVLDKRMARAFAI